MITTRKLVVSLAAAAILAATAPAPAHAEGIQSSGSQVFPGKFQVGVHLLGGQTGFLDFTTSGYKFATDFSGLLMSPSFGGLWLGGGLNFTVCGSDCGKDLQLWVFVRLTFEKLIPIPLVPFAEAGIAGDILFYGETGGAASIRFGGGVDYWLLKWLGLGVATHFTLGPGKLPHSDTFFYGTWDATIGARFAF